MLVLSRQRDETIMIGDDIEITIVDIRGDKVRLGITAPATIPVHRKEVYEAIQRENREASKVKMEDLPNLPGQPGKMPGKGPPIGPRIPVTRPPHQGNQGAPGGEPRNGAVPPAIRPQTPTPPSTPPGTQSGPAGTGSAGTA